MKNENTYIIRAFVFSHSNKIPTGTVVFVENGKTIGNARLDENGIATLKVPKDKISSEICQITAHYAGSRYFAPSVSEAVVKVIK